MTDNIENTGVSPKQRSRANAERRSSPMSATTSTLSDGLAAQTIAADMGGALNPMIPMTSLERSSTLTTTTRQPNPKCYRLWAGVEDSVWTHESFQAIRHSGNRYLSCRYLLVVLAWSGISASREARIANNERSGRLVEGRYR